MDSSGIIHNVLSPLLTIPIPITVGEMDLQHSQKKKTHCLRCAKRVGSIPKCFLDSLLVTVWGQGQQDAMSGAASRRRSTLSTVAIIGGQPLVGWASKGVWMERGGQEAI